MLLQQLLPEPMNTVDMPQFATKEDRTEARAEAERALHTWSAAPAASNKDIYEMSASRRSGNYKMCSNQVKKHYGHWFLTLNRASTGT